MILAYNMLSHSHFLPLAENRTVSQRKTSKARVHVVGIYTEA